LIYVTRWRYPAFQQPRLHVIATALSSDWLFMLLAFPDKFSHSNVANVIGKSILNYSD